MRLLLDQNLSFKLIELLADVFPGAEHVRHVGLGSADDEAVWQYAKEHRCVILTKDGDFHQRSFLLGPRPKVIWLRVGNCTTHQAEALLRARAKEIAAFVEDEIAALLVVEN